MPSRSNKSGDASTGTGRKRRSRSARQPAEPERREEPPNISQLIGQELQRRFAQAIEPVVTDLPQQIMSAIHPALQQLQESMAHVMQQVARQALQIEDRSAVQQHSGGEQAAAPAREAGAHGAQGEPGGAESRVSESAGTDDRIQTGEGESQMTNDSSADDRPQASEGGAGGNAAQAQSEGPAQQQSGQQAQAQSGEQARGQRNGKQAGAQGGQAAREGSRQSSQRSRPRGGRDTYPFDARGAARAGLLNLAHTMKENGAIFQAIHAYERILVRYPGTGAADAATEGLVDLAERLQSQGRIYTALNIFDKLEQLL